VSDECHHEAHMKKTAGKFYASRLVSLYRLGSFDASIGLPNSREPYNIGLFVRSAPMPSNELLLAKVMNKANARRVSGQRGDK